MLNPFQTNGKCFSNSDVNAFVINDKPYQEAAANLKKRNIHLLKHVIRLFIRQVKTKEITDQMKKK